MALSTADGLLLTIANALSHDLYYKMIDPNAPTARRVMISKILLLVVALAAAYVASQKPADILFLVSAAFSLAAAAFFPALTLGIFWKRANKWGALAGMASGPVSPMITWHFEATFRSTEVQVVPRTQACVCLVRGHRLRGGWRGLSAQRRGVAEGLYGSAGHPQ